MESVCHSADVVTIELRRGLRASTDPRRVQNMAKVLFCAGKWQISSEVGPLYLGQLIARG